MWMWTLDAKLINLALVESIELLEVYPEGTETEEPETTELDPEYFELVAFLPSGSDAVLYESEDAEAAHQAFEVIAAFVARDGTIDGSATNEPVSVTLLLERLRNAKN